MIVSLAICGLGVLQIYSATMSTKWADAWWKQIVWVGSGLLMMWAISAIDYHALLHRVFYLYGAALALLIVTALVGGRVFGSTRWIKAGPIHFSDFRIREDRIDFAGGEDAGGHSRR